MSPPSPSALSSSPPSRPLTSPVSRASLINRSLVLQSLAAAGVAALTVVLMWLAAPKAGQDAGFVPHNTLPEGAEAAPLDEASPMSGVLECRQPPSLTARGFARHARVEVPSTYQRRLVIDYLVEVTDSYL